MSVFLGMNVTNTFPFTLIDDYYCQLTLKQAKREMTDINHSVFLHTIPAQRDSENRRDTHILYETHRRNSQKFSIS